MEGWRPLHGDFFDTVHAVTISQQVCNSSTSQALRRLSCIEVLVVDHCLISDSFLYDLRNLEELKILLITQPRIEAGASLQWQFARKTASAELEYAADWR